MNWSTNSYGPRSQSAADEPVWHDYHVNEAFWTRSLPATVQSSYLSTLLNSTTAGERHGSSILLQQGDATTTPPLTGQEQTQWDDLTHGVQWAIIKIACENDVPTNPRKTKQRFSFVVSAVLRLKRRQIQAFLSVYVDDFERWEKFQKTAATIDWPAIIQLAQDRQMPLHQLLPKNRPRLSTDSISPEAVQKGIAYLETARLRVFARRLSDWIGTNVYGDFLALSVEAELLSDYLDGRSLRKAAMLGWIDLRQIRENLYMQRTESGLATRAETSGVFSKDFEGDPSPVYFRNEYEQLRVRPRMDNAGPIQGGSTQAYEGGSAPRANRSNNGAAVVHRENMQTGARCPTHQETQDTCAAFDRLITIPHGAWRTGIPGSQVTTELERQQLLPRTRSAAARPTNMPAAAAKTRTASPGVQRTRNATTSRARAASQGPTITTQPLPGPSRSKKTARDAEANDNNSVIAEDENYEQALEIVQRTRGTTGSSTTSNRTTHNLTHSNSTFAPVVGGSVTPDSLPNHQQVRTTAKAMGLGPSPSQSPQEYDGAAQNTLKRNRRPSRRLRDKLESDTDYRPESDDNAQPARKKKKQQQSQSRKTNALKKTAESCRNSQLDGPQSQTPSPQLNDAELLLSAQLGGGVDEQVGAGQAAVEQMNPHLPNPELVKLPQPRAGARAMLGMNLHSPFAITGTGRLNTSHYAWSAHTAYFSWVTTEARYALHVTGSHSESDSGGVGVGVGVGMATGGTRTRSPPNASRMEEARTEMNACVQMFQKIEEESATVGGQDANSASYAGLSDIATYAVYAERATYIL